MDLSTKIRTSRENAPQKRLSRKQEDTDRIILQKELTYQDRVTEKRLMLDEHKNNVLENSSGSPIPSTSTCSTDEHIMDLSKKLRTSRESEPQKRLSREEEDEYMMSLIKKFRPSREGEPHKWLPRHTEEELATIPECVRKNNQELKDLQNAAARAPISYSPRLNITQNYSKDVEQMSVESQKLNQGQPLVWVPPPPPDPPNPHRK